MREHEGVAHPRADGLVVVQLAAIEALAVPQPDHHDAVVTLPLVAAVHQRPQFLPRRCRTPDGEDADIALARCAAGNRVGAVERKPLAARLEVVETVRNLRETEPGLPGVCLVDEHITEQFAQLQEVQVVADGDHDVGFQLDLDLVGEAALHDQAGAADRDAARETDRPVTGGAVVVGVVGENPVVPHLRVAADGDAVVPLLRWRRLRLRVRLDRRHRRLGVRLLVLRREGGGQKQGSNHGQAGSATRNRR